MNHGNYKLLKQKNGSFYFAEVSLTVEESEKLEIIFDIEEEGLVKWFKPSILFAINYVESKIFFEKEINTSSKVTIKSLRVTAVDSTHSSVVYVTAKAYSEAIGLSKDYIDIDWDEKKLKIEL